MNTGCVVAGLKEVAKAMVARAKPEDSGKHYASAEEEVIVFNRYALPDGRVLVEDLQDTVVIGGQHLLFLALKDERNQWVKWSRWSEAELETAAEHFKFTGNPRGLELITAG